MNRLEMTLLIISMIMLWNCNSPSKEKNNLQNQHVQKTEIVTKSYAVKLENGNAIKDTVSMIQSMIVDGKGKELENIFYNLDGSVSWSDKYEFDKDGNKNGSRYYDDTGKQIIYYEYDLDSIGRRIAYRAKDINTDTLLYDGASRYLDNGKIRRDGYINKSGDFKYNLEYKFDAEGKELGYVYIDLRSGEKYPSTYKYTDFDKDGKWIERQIIENEKVNGFEVRTFVKIQ